jgi:putative transposase
LSRGNQHPGVVPLTTAQPNDLWTADFKGHFRTRDGMYCYPLTIADQHTRYLLACHGLLSTKGHGVRPVFDRLFREYGLPRAIRTDNGVPFATTGIRGLSQLNVWWLRPGIQHQRILPAHPEQNGAHERMHRTLKGEACRPPRATLVTQQRASIPFGGSTTTSGLTRRCRIGRPPRSIGPRRARTRAPCRPSSTPGTSSSSA